MPYAFFLHSFMRFWGEKNSSLQNASLFPTEPMNVFFRHVYPRAGARPLFHCPMFYLFLILFNLYLTRVATLSFTSLFQDGHGACMPLDCGRKPEDLEETHACTGRTQRGSGLPGLQPRTSTIYKDQTKVVWVKLPALYIAGLGTHNLLHP